MKEISTKTILGAMTLAALAWTLALSPASIRAESFFAGKTIRVLAGYSPGGGHDLESRVVARHLGKYIPGNPSVIVQNMPGASGLIQLTYIYNRAKPDGLTMGPIASTPFLFAVMGEDIKYDLTRMSPIWAVGGSYVYVARDFVGAKTGKDLVKVDPSKIVIGGRTSKGSACTKSRLTLELLGVKGYKRVCAYRGSADIKGALERGEASYFNANDAHLKGSGLLVEMAGKGLVVPMFQNGVLTPEGEIVRSPTVDPSIPTFKEVYEQVHGKSPSGVLWETFKATSLDLSRLVRLWLLPPGMPADRLATIRRAVDAMGNDPAFVSDWERIFGQELAPLKVPVSQAEQLKNGFLKPAKWQEYLRDFVSK